MIYLQLFFCFLKIGLTSFGGLSMVPPITSEMTTRAWMTTSQVSDIIAIAEMTPGPLGLNCASFAGMQTAGVAGALFASLGILTPSLTIGVAAAIYFEKFKTSSTLNKMMMGIRPACIGMISAVVLSMAQDNYFTPQGSLSPVAVGIGLLDIFLLLKKKMNIPFVLGISALLGVVCYGFLGIPM